MKRLPVFILLSLLAVILIIGCPFCSAYKVFPDNDYESDLNCQEMVPVTTNVPLYYALESYNEGDYEEALRKTDESLIWITKTHPELGIDDPTDVSITQHIPYWQEIRNAIAYKLEEMEGSTSDKLNEEKSDELNEKAKRVASIVLTKTGERALKNYNLIDPTVSELKEEIIASFEGDLAFAITKEFDLGDNSARAIIAACELSQIVPDLVSLSMAYSSGGSSVVLEEYITDWITNHLIETIIEEKTVSL